MIVNFDDIILEKEQKDLLIALVEAARQQPREHRSKFLVSLTMGGTDIIGLDDFPNPYKGDVEILARAGLLNAAHTRKGTLAFDVSPFGFRYYEHLMKSSGKATDRVEENLFRYLDGSGFEKRHPQAFAKWQQAQDMLWASDSQQQHTIIGHLCREAMQFFATSSVEARQLLDADPDVTKTVRRIRAVLDGAKASTSDGVVRMLDALLAYWGTTNDLAQRQEHGAHKEGETLTWEDSSRLVFQTAIVMYEIDRTLKDTRS